jgi:aldehyde dehydrogenase (NAD+)
MFCSFHIPRCWLSELNAQIHASLRATFRSGLTKPLAWRRHQLLQLARFVKDHQDGLAAAIHADLAKPLLEAVMGEVAPIYERTLICARKIEEWAQETNITDQVQEWQKSWNPRVVRQAKGVVLIIACVRLSHPSACSIVSLTEIRL